MKEVRWYHGAAVIGDFSTALAYSDVTVPLKISECSVLLYHTTCMPNAHSSSVMYSAIALCSKPSYHRQDSVPQIRLLKISAKLFHKSF